MQNNNQDFKLYLKDFKHDLSSHLAVIESFLTVCKDHSFDKDTKILWGMANESFYEILKLFKENLQ